MMRQKSYPVIMLLTVFIVMRLGYFMYRTLYSIAFSINAFIYQLKIL